MTRDQCVCRRTTRFIMFHVNGAVWGCPREQFECRNSSFGEALVHSSSDWTTCSQLLKLVKLVKLNCHLWRCGSSFEHISIISRFCLSCVVYLQVVSWAASGSLALNLEGALEGDRNLEARRHLHMPATVQTWQVVLGVVGTAQHAPVYMQEATTTWKRQVLWSLLLSWW